jgi:hypothetical protein
MDRQQDALTPLGPSDIGALFECLQGALSPDPLTQKTAETILQSLEGRPNFCSCLAVSRWSLCPYSHEPARRPRTIWTRKHGGASVLVGPATPTTVPLPSRQQGCCLPASEFVDVLALAGFSRCRRSSPARARTGVLAGWPRCT